MHTMTESVEDGGQRTERLTREQMIEMLWRGFGSEGWAPESFREFLDSRSEEQLGNMIELLNAAAGQEPERTAGPGDLDAIGEEFERLSNTAIEELVVARIHLGNDEPEEASENLTAIGLNLDRMREILAMQREEAA